MHFHKVILLVFFLSHTMVSEAQNTKHILGTWQITLAVNRGIDLTKKDPDLGNIIFDEEKLTYTKGKQENPYIIKEGKLIWNPDTYKEEVWEITKMNRKELVLVKVSEDNRRSEIHLKKISKAY